MNNSNETYPCTGCGCCCKRIDKAIPYVQVEEDVEQLAKQFITDEWAKDDEPIKFGIQVGFIEGYKAASVKKWSDEDIEKAIQFGNDFIAYCKRNAFIKGHSLGRTTTIQEIEEYILHLKNEYGQVGYGDILDKIE